MRFSNKNLAFGLTALFFANFADDAFIGKLETMRMLNITSCNYKACSQNLNNQGHYAVCQTLGQLYTYAIHKDKELLDVVEADFGDKCPKFKGDFRKLIELEELSELIKAKPVVKKLANDIASEVS